MYEAVIFDWDGTLADTQEVLVVSFQAALKEKLGREVSAESIKKRIGIGTRKTFEEILNEIGASYDDALIRDLSEIKVDKEIELSKEIPLFEGAQELLEALDGRIKMALASMNHRKFIDHILKEKGLEKFFSVTLTANEVNKPKPAPDIFLKTAQKLKVVPERCVVVEDSIFGVEAAKAANMGCIAVAQAFYTKTQLCSAKPDLIVGSLREKAAMLGLIFR